MIKGWQIENTLGRRTGQGSEFVEVIVGASLCVWER